MQVSICFPFVRIRGALYVLAALFATACSGGSGGEGEDGARTQQTEVEADARAPARIVDLLADGQAVFGIFSGDHTPEQGRLMASTRETDFVFYSLESGPFDIEALEAYRQAMEMAAGERGARPMALRIPPIKDDPGAAPGRVQAALASGMQAVVFPHVESSEDAALAVSAMGSAGWPRDPRGRTVNMLIVEDQVGIAHVDEIAGTEGVSVVFAGPGDLRRAYEADMEAVENAIQEVLAACKRYDVPCGITAGAADIATRLEQGFRVIIVTEPEALAVGREAAGRSADL